MGLTDLDIVTLSGAHTLVRSEFLLKLRCAIEMSADMSQYSQQLTEFSQGILLCGYTACTPVHML
jgi:hypothetical protein